MKPQIHLEPYAITYRKVGDLRPNPRNAKTHPAAQEAGFTSALASSRVMSPLLTKPDGEIIAGELRWLVACKEGIELVPCIVIEHLNDRQMRALMLADNKITENGGWNAEILIEEIQFQLEVVDFNLEEIGFETASVDVLIASHEAKIADAADRVEAIDRSRPATTKLGDTWALGAHRIHCGDTLDPKSFAELMLGELAQQVVTDPPYNVRIEGHVSGLGKVVHPEFSMASGEMSQSEFRGFLTTSVASIIPYVVDGAILVVFMDWRHLSELLAAGEANKLALKNLCVWDKQNGGMGSLYRSQHELALIFKHGSAPHCNNIQLGKHGRNRGNVWNYPRADMFHRGRKEDLAAHPTVKPIAMIMDAIMDCSDRNGIILDPFGGSGTTLLAAERTGRRARLIELDPYYVDVTIKRWETMTGQRAVLVGSAEPQLEMAS